MNTIKYTIFCYNFLTLFGFADEEDSQESMDLLEDLEEIDGDADAYGVDFVKISDPEAASKHNVLNSPALVYYRKKTPLLYDGKITSCYTYLSRILTCPDVS